MKRLVPREFIVPTLLETERFRLRPLTIHDVVKDYDAVMTSKEHLRASLPWGWPPDDLTLEQDLIDLGWRQKEFQLETSFDYAVMSLDERRLLGCVYVDPPEKAGYDVEVSMRVRVDELDSDLEQALETTVRRWITEIWPFTRVAFPGRDMPWPEWDALPDVEDRGQRTVEVIFTSEGWHGNSDTEWAQLSRPSRLATSHGSR